MLKMNTMFMSNVYLNELYSDVSKAEGYLENFLSTKHSDSLREYIRYSNNLRQKTEKIRKEISNIESQLLLKDIANMIDTYLIEADAAVNAKRGRDINEYITRYTEANKIAGYINLYINRLNTKQFEENTARYLVILDRLNLIQLLNIIIIADVVVFNIILILWFTFKITKPIISLSQAADEISKGNFDVEQVVVNAEDEISVMADAFNRMASSIKNYIDEIKGKAELEGRLKEQEMQNLIMKNLLKEAELHALQSQINPHFIFNTLNAGVQLAILEGADRTSAFMDNMGHLFRYNIRKLDQPVTLREEISNINAYIYILKTRFADKIEFLHEIDESIIDIKMPCMILQPLIENAFIHGISEMEYGGKIMLKVVRIKDRVEVTIEDNGRGMNEEKIKQILEGGEENTLIYGRVKHGHTTGIGMGNVISRLKLFFNRDDIVSIFSSPGKGTRVVIRMPMGDVDKPEKNGEE
jgi:sensor histidine kinase YesM